MTKLKDEDPVLKARGIRAVMYVEILQHSLQNILVLSLSAKFSTNFKFNIQILIQIRIYSSL